MKNIEEMKNIENEKLRKYLMLPIGRKSNQTSIINLLWNVLAN